MIIEKNLIVVRRAKAKAYIALSEYAEAVLGSHLLEAMDHYFDAFEGVFPKEVLAEVDKREAAICPKPRRKEGG